VQCTWSQINKSMEINVSMVHGEKVFKGLSLFCVDSDFMEFLLIAAERSVIERFLGSNPPLPLLLHHFFLIYVPGLEFEK